MHRRGLREVRREDARRRGIAVSSEHRQVERAGLRLDAAVQRRRTKALRRRNAAGCQGR